MRWDMVHQQLATYLS
ncbi:hypothetical protein EJF18_70066 [Clavispora lusitaniae]|uniref:Uncharacterized protein n=1 Tax=Clavispora lusitaniae TaxID=36911 RepID=A0ACD0WR64_CLALS|nr:hypothetical protein EJF14_70066 [Clavispora lusitaniae]QFZ35668.1 hypothetical protein EJF16_70066 [Clavispora lusitaniae]QFZ41350.1 hypothetical protein EJF15_70066 [Clavispora lusitaniae]QFZ47028.1 hypothetical protein EJF18_70066 [Clavispora lusitaniae]QFZ52705.1 hypothetical protein EJF17_70066 [Clavispora lusitaniae]